MGYTNKIGSTTMTETVIRIEVDVCCVATIAALMAPVPLLRTIAAKELA